MNENMTKFEKSAQACALAMFDEVAQNQQDINSVLTQANVINSKMMGHYVKHNIAKDCIDINGKICKNSGLAVLIREIMQDNKASFTNDFASANRSSAINKAMFATDIWKEVQKRFSAGSTRYPLTSIKQELSHHMEDVGKIALTTSEDSTKRQYAINWNLLNSEKISIPQRSRVKYFLNASPIAQ